MNHPKNIPHTASKDFVLAEINSIVKKFPFIRCRYEYNPLSVTHFIEISPKEFYEINENFTSEENRITMFFIEKFPHEDILFLTSGDYIKITKPIYVAIGKFYKQDINQMVEEATREMLTRGIEPLSEKDIQELEVDRLKFLIKKMGGRFNNDERRIEGLFSSLYKKAGGDLSLFLKDLEETIALFPDKSDKLKKKNPESH